MLEDFKFVPGGETDQRGPAAAATAGVAKSNKQWIDGQLHTTKWANPNLTFSFPTAGAQYGSTPSNEHIKGFQAFDAGQQAAATYFLKAIASFSGLTFTLTTGANGDMRFAESDEVANQGAAAYAYLPTTNAAGGDVWTNHTNYEAVNMQPGNFGWRSLQHEIGHALGLLHGHDANNPFGKLPTQYDGHEFSIMTYNSYIGDTAGNGYENGPGSHPQTMMMMDIAALQYMYGANFTATANNTNTTYTFSTTTGQMFVNGVAEGTQPELNRIFRTIWDGGGIDTYDLSNYTTNLSIDLRPGLHSVFDAAQLAAIKANDPDNVIYARGNVFNALQYNGDVRSLIENARGGSGSDTFNGNIADNTFWGNGGGDTFVGREGNDTFFAGSGIDTAVFSGTKAQYTITRMNDGSIRVTDNVVGRDGADMIYDAEFLSFFDQTVNTNGIVGTTTYAFGPTVSGAFAMTPQGGGWNSMNQFPRQLADVNGDGAKDFVGFGTAGVYVQLSNATGQTFVKAEFGNGPQGGGWSSQDEFPRILGDVNGDGKADIVAFGHAGVIVSLATANGNFGPSVLVKNEFGYTNGGWTSQDKFPRQLADVNGDGRDDIVAFGNGGVFVSLAQANGTFGPTNLVKNDFGLLGPAGSWTSQDQFPRILGDVNGDGRADIVAFGNAGVFVALGNANGTFGATNFVSNEFGFLPPAGGWTSQDKFPRQLGDVNGDGRADIVAFGNGGVYVAFGQANGTFGAAAFVRAEYGYLPAAGNWNGQDRNPRFVVDADGDGVADIVGFGEAGLYFTRSIPSNTPDHGDTGSSAAHSSSGSADVELTWLGLGIDPTAVATPADHGLAPSTSGDWAI